MNNDTTLPACGQMLAESLDLPPRYKYLRILGTGGMGLVVEAVDLDLEQNVAIKILHEGLSSEHHQRFLREARTLAQLQNPHIVKIKSFGITDSGKPFQVMEILQGRSLSSLLAGGPITAEQFRRIFTQAAAGLEYARQNGVVHRDIKPSNIFLQSHEGQEIVKIVDFGIARMEDADQAATQGLTATNVAIGSPPYMSPEQCRGMSVDYLSDVYSLGCVMYECLSGGPPFQGETPLDTMYQHVTAQPRPLEAKTASMQALADMVMTCLAKNPESRIQCYDQIKAILELSVPAETISIGMRRDNPLPPKKKKAAWFCATMVMALLLVAVGLAAYKTGKRQITTFTQEQLLRKGSPADDQLRMMQLHLAQLERVHAAEDRKAIYSALFNDCEQIANVFARYGDTENAIKYAQKAMDYTAGSQWPLKHKILANKQLAIYYRDSEQPAQAERYFQSAMDIYKEAANPTLLRDTARTAMELAILYARQGELAKARELIATYMPLLKNVMCDPEIEARAARLTPADYRTEIAMTVYGQMIGRAKIRTAEDKVNAVEIYLTIADYLLHFKDRNREADRVLAQAQKTLTEIPAAAKDVPALRNRLISLRIVEAKLNGRTYTLKALEPAVAPGQEKR